jgi:hypothetical protein
MGKPLIITYLNRLFRISDRSLELLLMLTSGVMTNLKMFNPISSSQQLNTLSSKKAIECSSPWSHPLQPTILTISVKIPERVAQWWLNLSSSSSTKTPLTCQPMALSTQSPASKPTVSLRTPCNRSWAPLSRCNRLIRYHHRERSHHHHTYQYQGINCWHKSRRICLKLDSQRIRCNRERSISHWTWVRWYRVALILKARMKMSLGYLDTITLINQSQMHSLWSKSSQLNHQVLKLNNFPSKRSQKVPHQVQPNH